MTRRLVLLFALLALLAALLAVPLLKKMTPTPPSAEDMPAPTATEDTPVAASAEDMPSLLFDSYAYGMPRSEAEKIPGIEPGEGDMEGELILPGVAWIDLPWTARFIFDNDVLVEISLVGPYTRETFNAIRADGQGAKRDFRHCPGQQGA